MHTHLTRALFNLGLVDDIHWGILVVGCCPNFIEWRPAGSEYHYDRHSTDQQGMLLMGSASLAHCM